MSSSANVSTTLNFRHIFGISASTADNISVLDDNRVAYVAGNSLIVYDKTDNRQQFIQGPDITEIITAFTVGATRKHAALAEKGERPKIHVFDLTTARMKKTLTAVEVKGKEIVCLQFSEDDQTILSLSGAPDYTLMCWNWMKGKLVASILVSQGLHMTRCSLNPAVAKDPLACVTGKDSVKFFRISDRSIRLLKDNAREGHNFTAHHWTRENYEYDTVIAATDAGDLLVYRTGEYVCRLACSPGPLVHITFLLTLPSGFVCGSKSGDLSIVRFVAADYTVKEQSKTGKSTRDADDDKATTAASRIDPEIYSSQFAVVNHVRSELSNGAVLAMSCSPSESTICAVYSDNQVLTFPATSLSTLAPSHMRYLTCAFHEAKPVLGLDVCVRKPIIVSCGADNTLRIWNFVKNTLELQKYFPEEMFSVALHPTGLHCAIGFADRLRLYHILVDDLKVCVELPVKNCRECRFSDGGNLIAAVSGHGILVFDFFTAEKVADLKGHNNKVRSLFWLEGGDELLSSGQDGAIYLWDVMGNRRITNREFIKKSVFYTSVVYSGVNGSIFAVGSDRLLKELSASDFTLLKDIDGGGYLLNQIALSHSKKALLVSTGEPFKPGGIRVFNYPLLTSDYTEYPCTSSAISRMCITPDENFAVVADESGCICIYEIHDRPTNKTQAAKRKPVEGTVANTPELISVEAWGDEILVPRIDLEDRSHAISDLKMKLREQKFQNDFKLKLRDTEYTEHTKDVNDKFVQDLEAARIRLEQLRERKSKTEAHCVEELKTQNDQHQNQIQTLETKYQSELMDKVDAYHQLMRRRDAQKDRLDEQRKKLKHAHEKYTEELIRDYEARVEEARASRAAAEKEREVILSNVNEMQNQLEDDIDTEVERLCKSYNDQLLSLREKSMRDKGQLGINKKKCLVVQKEMEELRELTAQLLDRERELHEQIIALEKEIAIHKKEIKSRDISIGDKEKRVYELKKKNQELDKFKFVLDFKIRELKQQIEPRQKEITEMKNKIKDMDRSLEEYHLGNSELDAKIGVIRQKIDELTMEIKRTRINAKQQENSINNFRIAVNQAVNYVLLPERLAEEVSKLIEIHCANGAAPLKIEEEVEVEYDRHKDFLQRSVGEIKQALTQEMSARTGTNKKLMQDNMTIIVDINKQRSANRTLKNSIQADIGRLRHYAGKRKKANTAERAMSHSFDEAMLDEPSVDMDPTYLLERNRLRIDALRKAIDSLQSSIIQRSYSREILPPMVGIVVADDESP